MLGPINTEIVFRGSEAVLTGPTGDIGDFRDLRGLEGSCGVQRFQMNNLGLRDVTIFQVFYYDLKGPVWTLKYQICCSEHLLNPEKLNDILNLPVDQEPSER